MQIGDKVFYPMHGAGVISAVESCEVLGEKKVFLVIKIQIVIMYVIITRDIELKLWIWVLI